MLPYSNHIRTDNAAKTLKYHSFTLDFSRQNGVSYKLSNAITAPQRVSHTQCFREQNHRQNDQSGPRHFPMYR